MNEEQIIQQFQALKKHREIILENGIDKKTFREIINKRYTVEELEAFKWKRSHERTNVRQEKYYHLYHTDGEYRKKKQQKARIYYWVKKTLKSYKV